MQPSIKLYTDLSGYYDLMCADIDYPEQSSSVRRLNQLFGNGGQRHLDLSCGTGPHIRHFLDSGYQSQGLDINQPMLDKAKGLQGISRLPRPGATGLVERSEIPA
jgi:ubiquinone/menaquinone biosynthesis C-methylase UbiE